MIVVMKPDATAEQVEHMVGHISSLGLSPQVPAIQDFIVRELARLEDIVPARFERRDVEPRLSTLFRTVLHDAWA